MSSAKDPRVDTYIEEAAAFAQPILRHLRKIVFRGCPTATETIKWGFPHFMYEGEILTSMAAFKAHCSFGFWHQGMEKILRADGRAGQDAMGSFGRITQLQELPDDAALLGYVQAAVRLKTSGGPARPSRSAGTRKPEPPLPPELAAALQQNKEAAATFQGFSPSHRREYIEWIQEAKREETRLTRVATAIEWLAEGKPRNWKYMSC